MPFEVIKRVADHNVKGLQMGERHQHKFNKGVSFRLPDTEARQAEDIASRFGQDRTDGKDAEVLVQKIPDRSTGNLYAMGVSFDEDGNIVRKE